MSEGPDMDDREGLAAEYVLGTLPLAERLQAERLIASDPAFAALVEGWRDHLAPIDQGYDPLAPPADLLARIEERMFPEPPRLARWRLPFLGAIAAALAALLLVAYLPGTAPPRPTLTATLAGDDQPLLVSAAFYADSGEIAFTRTGGPAADAGSDYELWIIPEGQQAVSLGVLREGEHRVPVDALPPGTTLAVTLETAGGSPTGVAQGPLLVAAVIGQQG